MNYFEAIKQILDNSGVYYLVFVDMNGQYAYLNRKYQNAFKELHGKLIGQHYSKTMHADDTKICMHVSQQCFEHPGRIFPATIRKHDGKGGYITTQWEYKAVYDDQKSPTGILCIGNDITEYLATRINLKETMKSLSHANLTLEEIAHIQSHVIRKPIANILGLAAILETMEVDQGLKDLVDMISSSTKELDEVIRSVSKKI